VNWFKRQRLEWINETIRIYGFMNREHVEKKFDISTPQASMDFRDVMKDCQWIRYNVHTKRYTYEVPEF
jgi:hypothetical protein